MKLEQFKEIADENLRDLYVDERMVSRIHRKLCAVPVRRKARVPRASALLAAACVVVMLLSGGVLLHGTGLLQPAASAAPGAAPAVPQILVRINGRIPKLGSLAVLFHTVPNRKSAGPISKMAGRPETSI